MSQLTDAILCYGFTVGDEDEPPESMKCANRGIPVELGQRWPSGLESRAQWRLRLQTFCEKASIPFEEPQWILCSYWTI